MKALSTVTLVLLAFFMYVMIEPTPERRIARTCVPILWVGNILESFGLLADEKYANSIKDGTDGIDYGCRYTVWRFFYEKEYLEQQEKQREQQKRLGGGVVRDNPDESFVYSN